MELTDQQREGKGILSEIITKAWDDEAFKKALIENPKQTLEAYFDTDLPSHKIIKVTDQSDPDYLYINIPVKCNNEKRI